MSHFCLYVGDFKVEKERHICKRCGKVWIEEWTTIGGDGFGDRCAATVDVPILVAEDDT